MLNYVFQNEGDKSTATALTKATTAIQVRRKVPMGVDPRK